MGFLERSKSQRGKDPKALPTHGEPGVESETEREGSTKINRAVSKRKSIFQFAAASPTQDDTKLLGPPKSPLIPSSPRTDEEPDQQPEDKRANNNAIDFKTGNDTFSFPTPSPRFPEKTSHLASPSPLASAHSSPRIGIALGSPSNAPMYHRSYTADQVLTRTERQQLPVTAQTWEQTSTEPQQRPQMRKSKSAWKTFGSLFKSKHAKQDVLEPFEGYASQHHASAPTLQARDPKGARESATPSPVPGSNPPHHSHNGSAHRGFVRFEARAEADRANYMASLDRRIVHGPATPREFAEAQNRSSPPRQQPDVKKQLPRQPGHVNVEDEWPSVIPRTPKLDVDIPDVQLDRYSVMFEKLLQPKRASILERRQSRLTLLSNTSGKNDSATALVPNPKDDEPLPPVPQRSVTSPHLTRMPPLNIKTDSRDKKQNAKPVAFHRPRRLARSNTAPTNAVSPAKASFVHKNMPPLAEGNAPHSADSPPSSPAYSEASLPPTPNTVHTVGESVSISVPPFDPSTMPTPRLSKYHMQAPPVPQLRNSEEDAPVDSRYMRVKSPEDLERQIVQVSVARQVSVSKARRQVRNTVDVKQPLRPRVVELGKNRKSTVGLILESDD